MSTEKLARCPDCDLLIPVGYQLGLRPTLYCQVPAHWEGQGYNAAEISAAIRAHDDRQQRWVETKQSMKDMLARARQIKDEPELKVQDASTDTDIDKQLRQWLRWSDHSSTSDNPQ